MKKIIIFPFAYIKDNNSGVNIKSEKALETYLKNLCVSAISARVHNSSDIDVAVVSNFDIPSKYRKILETFKILFYFEKFDTFVFPKNYLWNLAFYKLDIMYKFSHNYDYDYFIYLDIDVFVQDSLDNIFEEAKTNILLYDINHGLQVEDYRILIDECERYFKEKRMITHYGGEFFASSKEKASIFSEKCLEVFNEMILKNIQTTKGDEFIISIAADSLKKIIKNSGAYVYRYWTGNFRLVSTNYANNHVSILHCPAEKEDGFLKLFKIYSKNKMITNKKAFRYLHITHKNFKNCIVSIFKKFNSKNTLN